MSVARVTGRANIPTLIETVCGTNHPPATMAADQKRTQQVFVPSVVAPRTLPVVRQLLLSQAQVSGSMIAGTGTGIHSSVGRSAWLVRRPSPGLAEPAAMRGWVLSTAWFRKCHSQVTPEINRALMVKGFLVLGVTLT